MRATLLFLLLAAATALPAAGPAHAAGAADPGVRLPPLRLHGAAVASPARVGVEELDGLAPATEWVVFDPYERRDVRYSGIQLRDLVRAVAPEARRVRMRAINDYIASFEREEWERLPILLATRREGARMPVSNKGPARIVYRQTRDNEMQMQVHAPKWIWQVSDVEFLAR